MSDSSAKPSEAVAGELCLACGLCCNGVLFRDVELQPGDDPAALLSLGATVQRLKTKTRFPQPCVALCHDNRCRVYAERPQRCRAFECALFKAVAAGTTSTPDALRAIRTARQRAEKVRRLLRELGDADEQRPLSRRFNRMRRRFESEGLDEERADLFGQLTLAVHDLNLLLSEAFYPG